MKIGSVVRFEKEDYTILWLYFYLDRYKINIERIVRR